jgi:hypothetical protein
VSQAIKIPERRATRNLDRLTDDGLLMVASDGTPRALRSDQLAFPDGERKQTPGS